MSWYLLWKALHIMGFAAWMAGLWYLPRLMIYHHSTAAGSESSETFKVMERRLLKAITTPAMVATFVFGLIIFVSGNHLTSGWMHAKLLLLLAMAACHGVLAADVKKFAADQRPRSTRWYRIFNEVPTVLFVAIVLLAVLKPF
ncbi:MAG: protoporphyrinogen oxidase HemJ [Geminicoccaceae bacterium]